MVIAIDIDAYIYTAIILLMFSAGHDASFVRCTQFCSILMYFALNKKKFGATTNYLL
jgi:hypothetical protein